MSHESLNIQLWEPFEANNKQFRYNKANLYYGLLDNASKMFFYLRMRFGNPNVGFATVKKYFREEKFSVGERWCYLLKSGQSYVAFTGDDKINVCVFSLDDGPDSIDFEVFASHFEKELENVNIQQYTEFRYNLYLNYCFFIKGILEKYLGQIKGDSPIRPESMSMTFDELESEDPETIYKFEEYYRDYNQWLMKTEERAAICLQIQLIYPVYFEALIDLAFRVKLRGSKYNEQIEHNGKSFDLFSFFERQSIPKKLELIKEKCFDVNEYKISNLMKECWNYDLRKERNKLFHGNALYFKNGNVDLFYVDKYLIGFPDHSRAFEAMAQSIFQVIETKDIKQFIEQYKAKCDELLDAFDDNNYLRELSNGVVYALNTKKGGAMSFPINNISKLLAPTKFKK